MARLRDRVALAMAALAAWPVAAASEAPVTGGVALFLGPVAQALPVGMPFTAEYEETEVDEPGGRPRQVRAGTVYVDRAGRIRNEDRAAGVVQITDPVARTMTQLDLRTGTVRFRMPWPELPKPSMAQVPRAAAPAPSAPFRPAEAEDLGEREIEGLACRGSRFTVEHSGATAEAESWHSHELGLILRSRHLAEGRERVFAFTQIRRGDPDPRLFAATE